MQGTGRWLVDGGPWMYALLVVGFPATMAGIVGFIGGLLLRSRKAARILSGMALVLGLSILGIGYEAATVQTRQTVAVESASPKSDRQSIAEEGHHNADVPRGLSFGLSVLPFGAALMLGVRGFLGLGGPRSLRGSEE